MQTPYQLSGSNWAVDSNADSALYELEISGEIPNALLISVPDATSNTVVAVNASFSEFDSDAVVPDNSTVGRGLVVIPGAPQLLCLNTAGAATGNLYVGVASSANVTVYLTGLVV